MFMDCKGNTAVTTVQDSSGLHKILHCLLSFTGQNNFFFFPQSKCSLPEKVVTRVTSERDESARECGKRLEATELGNYS